jgi:hypothetical protein
MNPTPPVQDSKIEGNRIIAIFDGWTIEPGMENEPDPYFNRGWNMVMLSNMRYHESWDWLMPVLRKCIDVIGLWAHTHQDDNKSRVWLRASDNIRVALTSVDIEKGFREIAALIQWYNQQTPQP